MTELVLVGCSKTKRAGTHQAATLYEPSPIFRKRVRFARSRGSAWGILSAKHGYLRPWEAVPTYDTHISARSAVWGAIVLQDLLADIDSLGVEQVLILAGSRYISPLVPELESQGVTVVDWNEGLASGERMAALDEAVRPGEQTTLSSV